MAAVLVYGADPEMRWRTLFQEARTAIQVKDWAKARAGLVALQPLVPGNATVLYNLAAAEARLGNRTGALEGLRNLAATGLIFNVAADDAFAGLRETLEYRAAERQIEENGRPVTHAEPAFTLPERDLIPEDIAYDPKTRRFFVSSVRKGKVVTADGKLFAQAEWSVFALRVDAARRLLWASTAWMEQCERCPAGDQGKTALVAFDLRSGAVKRRVPSPVEGVLGDMTIGKGGDLFVSEGLHGSVWRLRTGSNELERLDSAGEFFSPQTPALSDDEKTLYIPDYRRGIAAMDLATRAVHWLQAGQGIAVNGIDGLYRTGGSFLAVQNGTSPARIVRFSGDLRRQEVLEANWPGLGDPTHGVVVNGDFYFIANSGWGDYDDAGKKKPGAPAVESTIRKIHLRK